MPTYILQPQRRLPNSYAWTECNEQDAKRWAILRINSHQKAGKTYTTSKVFLAFESKRVAVATLDSINRTKAASTTPSLGARFPPTGRKIIAASLASPSHNPRKS